MNINSYCAIVLGWCITFWTSVFTWKFLLGNGENEYKCFLEQIQDNVVYVKPCFVPHVGSNVKRSSVKPCAWCMVRVPISSIGNWFFVIIWEGLLPIYISFPFFFQ